MQSHSPTMEVTHAHTHFLCTNLFMNIDTRLLESVFMQFLPSLVQVLHISLFSHLHLHPLSLHTSDSLFLQPLPSALEFFKKIPLKRLLEVPFIKFLCISHWLLCWSFSPPHSRYTCVDASHHRHLRLFSLSSLTKIYHRLSIQTSY